MSLILLLFDYMFIQGREADHSPPPSDEVNNAWSYVSTPQYVFMRGA